MMKYLLVFLVLAAAWWVWRKNHLQRTPTTKARPPALTPAPMVVCAYCGTHLPEADAVFASGAFFCDSAHKAAHERQP